MADKRLFEIKRFGRAFAAKIGFAAKQGIAIQAKEGINNNGEVIEGELAAGDCLGHLSREVTAGGEESLYLQSLLGGKLEGPYKVNDVCTIFEALEFEAEGADYLHAGDGDAIVAGTAINAELSFAAGKVKIASGGDNVTHLLAGKSLEPSVAGGFRIRVVKII